ncbi:MAG: hypothetical protein HKP10_09300 [Kiritimatiellales bacterium]|nr:hypothetical protein [Kiritimatiellales bacterium]
MGIKRALGQSQKIPGAMALGIGAFIAIAALSLATGMEPVTMWAAPMPLAIGLWLVPSCRLDRFPRTALGAIAIMSTVFIVGYSVTYGLGPRIRNKPHRVNYPGQALAQAVESRWHEKETVPLDYVISDEFLGGIVNHYGYDKAAVMIRGNLQRSTYLSEEQVQEKGAMVVWLKSRDQESKSQKALSAVFPDLTERYPELREQSDLIVPWPRRTDGKAGRYGIAYIPPAENMRDER